MVIGQNNAPSSAPINTVLLRKIDTETENYTKDDLYQCSDPALSIDKNRLHATNMNISQTYRPIGFVFMVAADVLELAYALWTA